MPASYDTIIVGVGGMGSAAMYHLTKRGQRVLAIEQFDLGHAQGSSHGETRIIRQAYFEGSKYVPIVRRASTLWHELSEAARTPLIFRTGSLEMSEPGYDFVDRSRASCLEHGLSHEMLDAAEVMRRHPAFHLTPETRAIFQPDGGYVLSEAGIGAHARLAQAQGAELHTGEKVLGIEPTSHGSLMIRTSHATYAAGHVVFTAGPWTSHLVPALAEQLATFKQAIAWFAPSDVGAFQPPKMPVFIHFGPQGEFYGLPRHSAAGFKVGGPHFGREAIDPDTPDRTPSDRQIAALQGFLQQYLPGAASPPIRTAGCVYTKTPDEDFVIDWHPEVPHALVISPCSGHGYKFTPVIGEIVAQMILDGKTELNIAPFGAGRFKRDRSARVSG